MVFKMPEVRARWTDKIQELLSVAAHKACLQHNATKTRVIHSHRHHTHELRSHKQIKLVEAPQECSNRRVKTN